MFRTICLIFALLLLPAQAWGACAYNAVGAKGEASSGDVTLGAPGSPATDDVWIAAVSSRDLVAHTFTDWNQIYQEGIDGQLMQFSVWWFRYAGSTPNLVVGHTAGSSIVGGIVQLRGCDNSGTPVNTLGTATEQTNDDTPTFLAITPTAASLVLAVWGYNDNLSITTGPSGMTQRLLALNTDGASGAYIYSVANAGVDTGALGATMTAQGSNDEAISMLIAIGEAVAVTGGTRGTLTGVGK